MYKREIGRCCKVRANHTSDMIRKMGACRRNTLSRRIAVCVAMRNRCRTAELTRRRDFTQASPDQLSYETRSRRSRPTICWVAPSYKLRAELAQSDGDPIIFGVNAADAEKAPFELASACVNRIKSTCPDTKNFLAYDGV